MKHHILASLDIILFVVAFLASQAFCVQFLSLLPVQPDTWMILSLGVSSLITILLFHYSRWSAFGLEWAKSAKAPAMLWLVALAALLIVPSMWLQEVLQVEENEALKQMLEIVIRRPEGYLVIGILGPVAEEVVFRGAILRRTLLWTQRPWVAIFVSAFLFAAIHGNMAQGIHAMLMGILLGYCYVKTLSIVPGLVIHWVNNTIAFGLYHVFPDKPDATLNDLFAGNTTAMYALIGITAVASVLALWKTSKAIGK